MSKLFKEVKSGETFLYEGEVYMKLLPQEGVDYSFDAVCLKDGDLALFSGIEIVEMVQIEITAKVELKVR